ncbi:hypothetical protein BC835DRAFT_1389692 [Cytidiella melzeri]|nr:hypothetical protein BC835DRAFT_1389692 [Cytidiella melzeri]
MASQLPDETLHEILQHSFFIPVLSAFAIKRDRRFSWYSRTTKPTQLLLVCRRWLRVATPLLYETVEIDSEDELADFARTLQANPTLGRMVHNLRLEGGYGRLLPVVVKHAPNIGVLSLQTNNLPTLPNNGLLRALPCFNPTKVYLHDYSRQKTKKSQVNARAITKALRMWKSLELVACIGCVWIDSLEVLFTALTETPLLSELGFSEHDLGHPLLSPILHRFVREAQIRAIRCYMNDGWILGYLERKDVPQYVKELLVYEDTEVTLR